MTRPAAVVRTWTPCVALMALAAYSAVMVESAPDDPKLLAALFPPWWSTARVFRAAAASGEVLGFGAAPGVVILHSQTAGLARRAIRAGAYLTLDRSRRGLCIS